MSSPTEYREEITNDEKRIAQERNERKNAREKERRERLNGKLTQLTFAKITSVRDGKIIFNMSDALHVVLGSKSQFDARAGRLRDVMPPLTCDCCQTFATLSTILLSSLGESETLSNTCCTSTVNYLLYISAWLHQLTITSWPQKGARPTIGDLNSCLHLRHFFPSKVHEDEFEVIFHNQHSKAMERIKKMCQIYNKNDTREEKRLRDENDKYPICGYVIVSGDYTISIFALHDREAAESNQDLNENTCTLYLCDSHGTQPWSYGKACVSYLTYNETNDESSFSNGQENDDIQFRKDDHTVHSEYVNRNTDIKKYNKVSETVGLKLFSSILFTLLEEHRRTAAASTVSSSTISPVSPFSANITSTAVVTTSNNQVNLIPYMTWTPVRRRTALRYNAESLKKFIDEEWLPKVLSGEKVQKEVHKFNFTPLECFWLLRSS